jgi:hypothetical protein
MPEVDTIRASSKKLSNVGLRTKNVGGYANNSDCGLNAWFTINKIGRIMRTENEIRIMKNGSCPLWKRSGLICVPKNLDAMLIHISQ